MSTPRFGGICFDRQHYTAAKNIGNKVLRGQGNVNMNSFEREPKNSHTALVCSAKPKLSFSHWSR